MIRRKPYLIQLFAVPLVLALATAGCATRRYVSKKVAPVDQKVDTLSTRMDQKVDTLAAGTDQKFAAANDKITAVASTEQRDISQVNERIATNEMRLGLASSAAQQAQTTAASAMTEAQANARRLDANSEAVRAASASMANALNYKLIEKANVTFGFNKSTLTPEAKAALDQLAAKVQSMPRVVLEVVGFADPVGAQDYNFDLSQKRADTVQRYLVTQRVPLHVIHAVGLGDQAPPSGLEADISSGSSKSESEQAARRVLIRVFGAPDIVPPVAAGGGGQK